MAGSMATLVRWDMWMTEGQAIVSPRCYMKQDGFLLRFHQTMALHSLEPELGFQVKYPLDTLTGVIRTHQFPFDMEITLTMIFCAVAVHTGKLDSKFKAILDNSTKWQYYGTPNVGGTLEMTWNTSLVRAEKVNIELWGYRETGW